MPRSVDAFHTTRNKLIFKMPFSQKVSNAKLYLFYYCPEMASTWNISGFKDCWRVCQPSYFLCLPTFPPTYVYLPSHLPMSTYLPTYLCLPTLTPTYVYLPSHLPMSTYLPPFLCLPTYLPTYLPNYVYLPCYLSIYLYTIAADPGASIGLVTILGHKD